MVRYIRHSISDIETVLSAIGNRVKDQRGNINGISVGVSSLRLRTFHKKGTVCVYCGLQATHFAIEKCSGSKLDIYHINLWGIRDGKEILFTHDHVHARSLGGADDLNNSVTACETCNGKKGIIENKLRGKLPTGSKTFKFKTIKKTVETYFAQDHVRKFFFIEA